MPKIPYDCPGCGQSETAEVQWSGEIRDGSEFSGRWVECRVCGLQGPKLVWDKMLKRRQAMQAALGITELSAIDRAYQRAIEYFGQKMFRELKANDEKKGNFLVWAPNRVDACSELEHHIIKLMRALQQRKKSEVTEYAADVANTVMGIERVLGAV